MDLPKINLDTLRTIPIAQKAGGLAVLLVLIIVGFYYYVFEPKHVEIAKLDGEIVTLEQEIQKLTIKVKHLDELIAASKELEIELAKKKESLPPREEAALLLKQLTDLGISLGLEIKLWKPGRESMDGTKLFVQMPVNVEVAGGYHTVALFFDRVSKLPRIINISNLRMDTPKMVDGRAVVRTVFDLTAFAAP